MQPKSRCWASSHHHSHALTHSCCALSLSFSLSCLVCHFLTLLLLTSLPPLRSNSFSLFLLPYLVFQDLLRSSSSWVQNKAGFQLVSERMNKSVVEFYNHLNHTVASTICAFTLHQTLSFLLWPECSKWNSWPRGTNQRAVLSSALNAGSPCEPRETFTLFPPCQTQTVQHGVTYGAPRCPPTS